MGGQPQQLGRKELANRLQITERTLYRQLAALEKKTPPESGGKENATLERQTQAIFVPAGRAAIRCSRARHSSQAQQTA
jgi:DNA-binding MarR family transcriptional regulator